MVNKPVYIVNNKGDRVPISVSCALLKDEKGNSIGGVETFRDLSLVEELRKQVEEKYCFEDIVSRSVPSRRSGPRRQAGSGRPT